MKKRQLPNSVLRLAQLLTTVLAVAFPLTGCGPISAVPPPDVAAVPASAVHPISVLGAPGIYWDTSWIGDWLVVQYDNGQFGSYAYSGRLWKLHPDGSGLQILTLPSYPGCLAAGFQEPKRLPDGRLSYLAICKEAGTYVSSDYLMAYDLQTKQAEPLVNYSLPSQVAEGYSWMPSASAGIMSDGNGLDEQLYWLRTDHADAINLGLSRAISPDWSPNGKQLAFFGAPEQHLEGLDRVDSLFNLYLMTPDGTDVHPILTGFFQPAALAWSPDSRWLVFDAKRGTGTLHNLWLVDVAQDKLYLLAIGNFRIPSWSDDGQKLVAIKTTGGLSTNDYQTQLVTINVSDMVRGTGN